MLRHRDHQVLTLHWYFTGAGEVHHCLREVLDSLSLVASVIAIASGMHLIMVEMHGAYSSWGSLNRWYVACRCGWYCHVFFTLVLRCLCTGSHCIGFRLLSGGLCSVGRFHAWVPARGLWFSVPNSRYFGVVVLPCVCGGC